MALNRAQIQFLKKYTHALKPVVWIGQHGLSDAIMAEMEIALDFHELVKCKVGMGDRDEREACIQSIIEKTGADCVQKVGKVAVFYRQNPDKNRYPLPKK